MLNVNVNSIGIAFSVNIDGHDIHFREWKDTNDCIYYFPLVTLVDNGHAELHRNECVVPYENIYLIDDDDKVLLGIPDKYDKSIRLRGESMLNSVDFKYRLEFLTHVPDGELLSCEQGENILCIGTEKYLLDENQYRLIKAVDDFNALDESKKTTDDLNFTLETVSCLGACGLAPVMMVDEDVHSKVTPEYAEKLIDTLRSQEKQ